jgi:hypothetical protein
MEQEDEQSPVKYELPTLAGNGGAKVCHGSGVMVALRAA